MLSRLARAVVRHPWLVIGGWLIGALAVILLAPPLNTDPDQNHSLPTRYQSVQAAETEEKAFKDRPEVFSGGYVVLKRADGKPLAAADVTASGKVADSLRAKHYKEVTTVFTRPSAVAKDRSLTRISVMVERTTDAKRLTEQGDAITAIRADLPGMLKGTGLTGKVGGDVAAYHDNLDTLNKALSIVTMATLVLIVGLILLIFRAPLAAILPIVAIAAALKVSLSVTAAVAKPFGLVFDQSLNIVVLIVIFGIGADYFLFLLWRFREGLRAGEDKHTALAHAVERAGRVIVGTALTTMCAVLVLLLATFRVFRAWGPALAVAVGVMAVTALTLIPALMRLLGTAVFWPSKSWQRQPRNVIPAKIGHLVSRRPGGVVLGSLALLAVLAGGVFTFHVSYDIQGGLPQQTEAASAQRELVKAVPAAAGLSHPVKVMLKGENGARPTEAQLDAFKAKAAGLPGIGEVEPPERGPSDPTVVRVNLLLDKDPYTDAAIIQMRDHLRAAIQKAAPAGVTATVGGITAGFGDIDHATRRDVPVILATAAALIAVILALVLRSLTAPLILVPTVMLGYAASLGTAVYVFQNGYGEVGLNFQLPLLLYLFVLAIGTDYNILMISRLREESEAGHDPRTAAGLAIQHAAPVAAAAGLILAGTFAVMLLAPSAMMRQMGFAVSLGIMVSAFVMATFLVPALSALLGRGLWWPSQITGRRTASRGRETVPVR